MSAEPVAEPLPPQAEYSPAGEVGRKMQAVVLPARFHSDSGIMGGSRSDLSEQDKLVESARLAGQRSCPLELTVADSCNSEQQPLDTVRQERLAGLPRRD